MKQTQLKTFINDFQLLNAANKNLVAKEIKHLLVCQESEKLDVSKFDESVDFVHLSTPEIVYRYKTKAITATDAILFIQANGDKIPLEIALKAARERGKKPKKNKR